MVRLNDHCMEGAANGLEGLPFDEVVRLRGVSSSSGELHEADRRVIASNRKGIEFFIDHLLRSCLVFLLTYVTLNGVEG
jgi:hypothetical protein